MPSCVFRKCFNYSAKTKTQGVSYHVFPSNEARLQKWTAVVRKQRRESDWAPTKSSTICTKHFKATDIYTSKEGLTLLRKNAVPVIQHTATEIITYENIQYLSDDSDSLIEDPEEDPPTARGDNPQELHVGLKCKKCWGEIRGFRYVCVQCSDWNMCGGCEARGKHPHHYVLRIPTPQSQQKVASMLEVLQKQLKTLVDELEDCREEELSNSTGEVEIKVEYDELNLHPDPLNQVVYEESVVPQFTPSTGRQEFIEETEEVPPLTEWPVLTVSRGIWNQENDTEKSKRQIKLESKLNQLIFDTCMKDVPPVNIKSEKHPQLNKSQPGTSANKRKKQEQACTNTKIPKVHSKSNTKKNQ